MTTRIPNRARLAGILTAITMTAALAACSADSGSDDASFGGETADYGSTEGDSDGVAAGEPEAAQDSGASESRAYSGDTASTVQNTVTPPTERAVISTGTVSLRSKDVAEARRSVQRVVDAQGGEVTEENTETDDEGETAYARLVVRVPSSKFAATMNELEGAAEMSSSNRAGEDVTTQVIDTDVRVRAQEASLKRVELLLSRAESLKQIIWIESQLTNRQAELDSLKSQQSWLKDQTSLSTITIDITKLTKKDVEKKEDKEEEAGFLVGLKGGMNALVAATAALATVVGAVLPFAVVLLVLGFPIWMLTRRRKTDPPQAAPEPQA